MTGPGEVPNADLRGFFSSDRRKICVHLRFSVFKCIWLRKSCKYNTFSPFLHGNH